MNKCKVLVVDDSCLFQRLLADVINEHKQMSVVGVAGNGKVALELMETTNPDLITLDILMPELDGIQTLIQLRKRWPHVRTIMLSTLTSAGSDAALDALALGASDYVAKPVSKNGISRIHSELAADLLPKIEALCGLENFSEKPESARNSEKSNVPASTSRVRSNSQIDLVAIGVSTGGPDALSKLLAEMPGDIPVPIVIVQHMPPVFTSKLATRLDSSSDLTVREAKIGDKLKAGTVYIAPGDFHMVLDKVNGEIVVCLNQDKPENSCRPSVDPLFRSIPEFYGSRCLGVIMTGMGQDGLKGSRSLVEAGCPVIVQDKCSSVVWGMPRLVATAGLAEEEVPLDQLASAIVSRLRGGGAGTKLSKVAESGKAANAPGFLRAKQAGGAHE